MLEKIATNCSGLVQNIVYSNNICFGLFQSIVYSTSFSE